jgi:hypothetical protein
MRVTHRFNSIPSSGFLLLLPFLLFGCAVEIGGDIELWDRAVLTFDGPWCSELGSPNPFMDFRLIVSFRQPSNSSTSPTVVNGFFAADGNAGETGATNGTKWRVYFAPTSVGNWSFSASFRNGTMIAIETNETAGTSAG